jgi:dTDP-4-amino-4,6-dideoxygalactose transaminase
MNRINRGSMSAGQRVGDLAVQIGPGEALDHFRPELPSLSEAARYYALSEDARVYGDGGPCVERLSARLGDYVGAGACVPVASGTLGLVVALVEATDGDRRRRLVATSAYAPPSVACAIRAAQREPLFVDVDPESWQLDPDALERALHTCRGEVACVMAGSVFGSAAPADTRARWREIARAHRIGLVIDSSAGFGAVDDQGRRLGGQGDTEVFSFDATRPFAIGEGGAICVADPDRAARLEQIAACGVDPDSAVALMAGINARLSELGAAMGLAMLDRYDDVLARRRGTAAQLRAVLADHPLTYQQGSEGSTWPVYQVLADGPPARERALRIAGELRIDVRTCFDPPLHRHPAFAAAPCVTRLPVTEELAARSLTLPLANGLGPRQVLRLAELGELAFS